MGEVVYKTLVFAVVIAVAVLLGCIDDDNGQLATPLPPDLPTDYTPAATADYSEW